MIWQPINPYYDYDTVRDASMFFGRQQELHKLFDAIKKRQCSAIVGPRHIGKSSVLKSLANPEIQQRYGYDLHDRVFILTDWREYLQKTCEDFFRSVCEQIIRQSRATITLQVPPEHLCGEDRFKRLLEDIGSAGFRPVLLMDVFDKVTRNPHFDPDFFSFLRALAGIYDLISYVTASVKPLHEVSHSEAVASSPFFNIFQTCTLSSLTLEETRDLITIPAQRAGHAFTPEEVERIITLAGRHPFYVQVTCRFLFEEKLRQNHNNADLNLIQEHLHHELAPHFMNSWNDLSEDQKQTLRLELVPSVEGRRKMPEFSESDLFRRQIRELLKTQGPELTSQELRDILDHRDDSDFLASSALANMHYVTLLAKEEPQTKKGVLVLRLLQAAFEQMKANGIRSDSAPEWRLYNILWYHYFRYRLPNGQTAARLGIGSMRQFYREQERAIQALLREILELEQRALNDGIV